jgi:aldehyde dehydrogenase (NAD+)
MSGIKLTIAELVKRQKDYYRTSATKDISTRIETLKLLKRGILAFEPRLSEALKKDLGKSEAEVITTEIGITIQEINNAIKGVQKWAKQNPVPTNWMNLGARSFVIKEPYGTCLIIAPWNYPFQLAISPLVGAIVAGNTVVLKPSEVSDHTSLVIKDLFDTFFDPRQVAVVLGGVAVTSELLEERFDKIFFTGSPAVGSIVMEKAAHFLTPVTLELGGKSPCIVDETCDLELAAKRIIFGKGINAGQTCVAPDYVLIHKTVKTQFAEIFNETLTLFYGEAPHLNPDFGQIINERHLKRLKSYLGDGVILAGGAYNEEDRRMDITLIEVSDSSLPIMQDEIFGPVLPLMTYEKIEDIIQIIHKNPDPLAFYVFSNNQVLIDQLILNVPFGGGCVNDTVMHVTNEHLPFGGRGTSGAGSYHGKHSFDTFSHEKAILVSSTTIDLKQKYPHYAKHAVGILKKALYR